MKERFEDIGFYEREIYLRPIFEGETVYGESVCVIEDFFGEIRPLRLAFPIGKVLSVRSADLSVRYEEGKDYAVNEYGELVILRTGKIPYLPWKDYRLKEFDPESDEQLPAADGIGAYCLKELFREREGMRAFQLAVTYEHAADGYYDVTAGKKSRLPRTAEKLAQTKRLRVASYGDSITYGWGSSGLEDVRKPPYCKKYCEMVVDGLEMIYGAKIEHGNFSVSGKCTDFALEEENVKKVTDFDPDLVILAFGMNDAGVFRPDTFRKNLLAVIGKIRAVCPKTEFVIVSPILPNPLVGFAAGSSIRRYHEEYPRVFESIERETAGVAYANVTRVHRLLLERKRLQDTLSNNANHPNDFMHRVYAQTVLKTITE